METSDIDFFKRELGYLETATCGSYQLGQAHGSLMEIESIAEGSPWNILQYFWPALSENWSRKTNLFFIFKSGRFTQVLPTVDGHFKNSSEYDQEIPQSQTADKPMASRGRATQQSRDTRKLTKQSNQLSLPHQDDYETRMDIK